MPMTLTRSLLTILIPGLIAIAPWLLLLVQYTSATLGFKENLTLANALVFTTAAVVGSLFEAAGSTREVAWDEERNEALAVKENWYIYLSRQLEREPVGYRYLSRLVTTLYFELAMMFAAPIFFAGACLLASFRFAANAPFMIIGSLMLIVSVAAYFRAQARCTHEVICKTRAQINARTLPANNSFNPMPLRGTG